MTFWDKLQKLSREFWENEEVFRGSARKSKEEKIVAKRKFLREARNAAALVLMTVFLGGGLGLAFLKAKTGDVEIVKREVSSVLPATQSSPSGGIRETMKVHLSGAVVKPGVYELTTGSRVDDLLMLAGGLSDEADATWAERNLNLAAKLKDEDRLYIPSKGELKGDSALEKTAGVVAGFSARSQTSRKFNINTATPSQLETLPGIGPAYASRIIEYRERSGPFSRVEDIQKVPGIGPKTFEKIRDKITVD